MHKEPLQKYHRLGNLEYVTTHPNLSIKRKLYSPTTGVLDFSFFLFSRRWSVCQSVGWFLFYIGEFFIFSMGFNVMFVLVKKKERKHFSSHLIILFYFFFFPQRYVWCLMWVCVFRALSLSLSLCLSLFFFVYYARHGNKLKRKLKVAKLYVAKQWFTSFIIYLCVLSILDLVQMRDSSRMNVFVSLRFMCCGFAYQMYPRHVYIQIQVKGRIYWNHLKKMTRNAFQNVTNCIVTTQ